MEEIEILGGLEAPGSYIESLVKSWKIIAEMVPPEHPIHEKILNVLTLELDLALMGAEKAKSEILKTDKNNIRPIK